MALKCLFLLPCSFHFRSFTKYQTDRDREDALYTKLVQANSWQYFDQSSFSCYKGKRIMVSHCAVSVTSTRCAVRDLPSSSRPNLCSARFRPFFSPSLGRCIASINHVRVSRNTREQHRAHCSGLLALTHIIVKIEGFSDLRRVRDAGG